ncbi:MAG: class II aldolase/adducin family protein [Casimicrobiaceae bacterium]
MIASDIRELSAQVIATALDMNALGINQGKSGNVSARVMPATASGTDALRDRFIITPTSVRYDRLQPDDLALMSLAAVDEREFTGKLLPSSEWRFHRDIYRARPDVQAIVHTHGVHATTLACLGRGIPAFHYMVAIAGGHDIRCAPYATFGTQALSDRVVSALADRHACLLAHHGLIATGASLERALAIAVEVETLARIYGQALQIGEPEVLSDEEMQRVLHRFRTYGQFQSGDV